MMSGAFSFQRIPKSHQPKGHPMYPSRIAILAVLTTVAGLTAAPDLLAVTKQRNNVQNGSGACQASLPNYEGQIRKRPLAIQNEGTEIAFVSCSFVGTDLGVGGTKSIDRLYIYVYNSNNTATNVSCTMVDGINFGSNTYFPKTQSVPQFAANYLYQWTAAADNAGVNFDNTVNVSCGLPPGTGITVTKVYFFEDVGA